MKDVRFYSSAVMAYIVSISFLSGDFSNNLLNSSLEIWLIGALSLNIFYNSQN